MNEDQFQILLSLSITVPFIACLLRLKQIPKSFYPVACLIILGFINELINYVFFPGSNAVPTNIYNLLEYLLYCWQFKKWEHILKNKYSFLLLTSSVSIYWIIDNLIFLKISTYASMYLIIYPFILVLLAVNELNFLVANEHGNILKNPLFIFCIAIIIFYSYRVLSEIFYHYAPDSNTKRNIFSIQSYVNVLFNILLTLVVLCLPKKRTITLR